MPQTLSKKLIFLSGLIILGTAITVLTLMDKPVAYGATPDGGTPGCGETCYQEAYQAKVSYVEPVCHNESVPVPHYYNSTRPVKRYYSYEQCTPGSCRTISGWNWDRDAKGKLYKHYYSRQECEPQSCRTVSGWNWDTETIRASYITWEPRPVCENVTRYKLETRYRPVCTPKVCSAPADSQCSWDGQKRCATSNQYQFCRKQSDGSFKWNTPLGCPASQVCDNGSCIPKPGVSNTPRAGGLCFSLSVAYGTGYGAPSQLTIGEDATFYLRWEPTDACKRAQMVPTDCVKWGGWSGDAAERGIIEGPRYTGTAPANYNDGWHNFQIACRYAGGSGYEIASNVASVHYVLKTRTVPPQQCSDECSSGQKQCLNSSQTRTCGNFDSDSCLEWGNLLSCVPSTQCSGGQCVRSDGQPVPGTENQGDQGNQGDSDGGSDIFGPGGIFGGGGTGGTGGAGFPAFGSTQCYDGKDNDNDGKIDNGVTIKGKYYPPDPGCLDSSGKYNPNDNSEFNYKLREIIPDFFNLNWFKVNVANFFRVEALGKE